MNNELPEVKKESEVQNLCKRGCGFYGSVQFGDMCSKCYQEQLKDQNSNAVSETDSTSHGTCMTIASRLEHTNNAQSHSPVGMTMRTGSANSIQSASRVAPPMKRKASSSVDLIFDSSDNSPPRTVSRCSWCRKRVGLTGFSCRCNGLFCSLHRYSDQHNCKFDYQAHGKEELTKANPEIRCPKIRKI